jgi:hypothetical protein
MAWHDTLFSLLFKIYRFIYMVSIDDMINFLNNIIFTSYHFIMTRDMTHWGLTVQNPIIIYT